MRRWLMLKVFSWITAKFARGDCDLVLTLMADDVHFIFPGYEFLRRRYHRQSRDRAVAPPVRGHASHLRDSRRHGLRAAVEHPSRSQDA